MDNTPTYIDSPTQKPSRKKTIWLVIIILTLIASNTGWALFYLKQQGELTTQINILKAQNIKLAKDNKDLQNADTKTDDTSEYREIPELGVKYKITNETENLTYAYNPIKESAGFSSIELFKAGGEDKENPETYNCDAGAGGSIARYKAGEEALIDGTKAEKVEGAKKIGNYYFIFHHVQGYCGEGNVETLAQKVNSATQKAFESLKSID